MEFFMSYEDKKTVLLLWNIYHAVHVYNDIYKYNADESDSST